MSTSCQFLSPTRQALLRPFERSSRRVVGYSMDFPDGLVTGMHSHPKSQLLYSITGVMRVETEDAVFIVPPTTALFIAANKRHSVEMKGIVAQRQLFIGPTRLGVADEVRILAVSPLLKEVIVALCGEGYDWKQPVRARHLASLAIHEIECANVLPFSLQLPRDPRVSRITSALTTAPGDCRTLTEWSEQTGASERTLARLFLRETSLTFRQWRQHARMIEAYAALITGGSLAATVRVAGYESAPAFGAAFRAHFGRTPGSVRSCRPTAHGCRK